VHREPLIELIREYGLRHPDEDQVVQRFLGFLLEHERCFERDCWAGHITGSAWLVNGSGTHVLLTHHRKLDRWLQVGGHSDGVADTLTVAITEAEEESGLPVRVLDKRIFDLDVHEIPARKSDPAHYHYDVRFVLEAREENFQVSPESHDLAWVPVDGLREYTGEESVLRMARKWLDGIGEGQGR
jgi:8-oxo-dGTP pyrophosphatase MutT (NUDIX family)